MLDPERPRAASRLRGSLGIALALLIAAIPIGWIVLAAMASDPKVDLLSAVTGGLVVAAAVLYAEHRSGELFQSMLSNLMSTGDERAHDALIDTWRFRRTHQIEATFSGRTEPNPAGFRVWSMNPHNPPPT